MFHLGWFVGGGYSVHGWNQPWSGSAAMRWTEPDLYIDMARALERACFDCLIIEDGSFVADVYQGSTEYYLKTALTVPKADPMPLVPLIGQATSRLGIVATVTTGFYPPFLAARLGATLDHLTHGRVGLNLVTAHNDRASQNYGLEKQYPHDMRYQIADEWMEVANRLWASWEPGAIVADPETGTFTDFTKVHPINFEGQFFKSRGPLNMPPGPQGRPVICQAGGSPAGRAFASKRADTIIALARDVAAAKSYRDDVRARATAHGRRPDDCKILFNVNLVLGETMQDAVDRKTRRNAGLAANMEARLAYMSYTTGMDFSKFDLDQPLPEIKTNNSQGITAMYNAHRKTLREIVLDPQGETLDLVGTADSVAATMGEMMDEIGGDGFLISELVNRRTLSEITDGLAAALQRRGLIRPSYSHKHFRDNLLAF
jgi:FMN-dependent oxidoreductase (nitrilotriacetate monooxygenase family)